MKIPKPRQVAQTGGSATRTNRTDGRVEKHKEYSDEVPVDVPPGESAVAATRGFKHWFSTRDAGITVESTMTVTLSCQQDMDSVMNAGEAAGHLAEKLAIHGCEDMDLYIKKFMDEAAT